METVSTVLPNTHPDFFCWCFFDYSDSTFFFAQQTQHFQALSLHFLLFGKASWRWILPFYMSSMAKTRGKGYNLFLGRFQLDTGGKFFTGTFSHWNHFPRKWWIPQCWILLRLSQMGWAILSRLRFHRERLDQMILDIPSKLVFYDSMFLSAQDPQSVWSKKFPSLDIKF